MNKVEELKYIINKLQQNPKAYLIEEVIGEMGANGTPSKEYCADDVHRWGMEDECYAVYGKVRDLVKVRIMKAVEDGRLDKVLAGEILKTYYYKPFADAMEKERGVKYNRMEKIKWE